MSITENELVELKNQIDKLKNIKIQAETRLEQLEKQKKEIYNDISSLGFKPENIEQEIVKLDSEIEKLVKDIKELMPQSI